MATRIIIKLKAAVAANREEEEFSRTVMISFYYCFHQGMNGKGCSVPVVQYLVRVVVVLALALGRNAVTVEDLLCLLVSCLTELAKFRTRISN